MENEIVTFKSGRIIDVSHYQVIDDLGGLFDNGVIAMIHKATESNGMIDAKFANRYSAWKGLKGSYHFLRGYNRHSGSDEAKHYLDVVQPKETEVMALDAEAQNLTLKDLIKHSEEFVEEIFNQTGRYPLFYINNSQVNEAVNAGYITNDSILAKCALWDARYGKAPTVPNSIWDKCTFWQYTDSEKDECITTADGDHFNGTTEELYTFWNVPMPAAAENGVTVDSPGAETN